MHVDQNSVSHQLRLQTKDESWDLFTQVVRILPETSQPEISPDVEMQKVKKKKKKFAEKVVGRCGGLPLSILRLGHLLLRTERVNCEALSRVLEHMDHNQTPWLETLEFNETDLPLDSLFTLSWPNYWKRPHLASCIFTHKAKIYHLVGLCLLC